MGFFDRFAGKKPDNGAVSASAPVEAAPTTAGGVMPQLVAARERLEAKDLPGALAIYEPVLAGAGDRADVLVTISADLGVNGHLKEIVELVAPRYDAERHGPATGLNLLQAYLALRQADAAQHVLDILFALQRPELEDRLHGFSNAIAELINSEAQPIDPSEPAAVELPKVNFVSISKPIWFYGLEPLAGQILPPKAGRLRRIAFTQLALVGVPDLATLTSEPETELGKFTRALPLWLAETFYFSPHYSPIAVVGVMTGRHYALLGAEWSQENLRQLAETTEGGLDYIVAGALREKDGIHDLILRLWEVKKYRERKTFTARWTSADADAVLRQLHEQVRTFMEWSPEKAGVAYTAPAQPAAWLGVLGSSLSVFLAGKELLPANQLVLPDSVASAAAQEAANSESGALAYLNLQRAARERGLAAEFPSAALKESAVVAGARDALA